MRTFEVVQHSADECLSIRHKPQGSAQTLLSANDSETDPVWNLFGIHLSVNSQATHYEPSLDKR